MRDLLSEARALAIISSMEQKLLSLSDATGGGFGATGEEPVVVSIARVLPAGSVSGEWLGMV